MSRDVIGHTGEATVIILLTICNITVQMPSKHFVYTHRLQGYQSQLWKDLFIRVGSGCWRDLLWKILKATPRS